jgi:hypothetical protein
MADLVFVAAVLFVFLGGLLFGKIAVLNGFFEPQCGLTPA